MSKFKVTVVPGEGPPHARVMLIGQNPGREEAKQGRPFIGMSGRYLNGVLAKNGIDRAALDITAAVKETTPRNRPPTKQEIERWRPLLLDEIRKIKPQIIVLMGNIARQTPRFPGIKYIETYHPAAAMRFPKVRAVFEKDFEKLKQMMDDWS